MFEKVFKHEKDDLADPDMPNREELLREIRNNNCREILSVNVSLKVLAKDGLLYPDKKEQVDTTITALKRKKKDLLIGVEYIDRELNEITARAKK